MEVAFFTSAFPARCGGGPESGIDAVLVRRAVALAGRAGVAVVAPVPAAPAPLPRLRARWAAYAATPRRERVAGLEVHRPRYPHAPGAGPLEGVGMAAGAFDVVRRLRAAERCDVLFAQAILPDGLAAVLVGRALGVPVACLGRGSDVHRAAVRSPLARRLARWTLAHAAAVASVGDELAERLLRLGSRQSVVLHGGVDLERFVPGPRAPARRRLGVPPGGALVLYVGRLADGKGLLSLLDAFVRITARCAEARLVLVGDGPLRAVLEARARGLGGGVTLVGPAPHDAVPTWMQAADVVVLPSEAEGFPNVVREALACGRPVVATAVGDVPRVVDDAVGRLVPPRAPQALADAVVAVLDADWPAGRLRARVAGMSWAQNATATHRFLEDAVRMREVA